MAFVYRPVVTRTAKDGRKTRKRTRFYWIGFTQEVDGVDDRRPLTLPDGSKVSDRETAEAELRRIVQLAQRRKAGLIDPDVESAGIPVRKVLADYLRHLRGKRRKNGKPLSRGYLWQTAHVGRWAVDRGMVKVADLQADRIGTALAGLHHVGKSMRTVQSYRGTLYGLCDYAVRVQRIMSANPIDKLEAMARTVKRERRALTPDEGVRLLAVDGGRALWYETALSTGLRVSEIASLRWADLSVDSLTPCIRLRAEHAKNAKTARLPLRRELAKKLQAARPKGAEDDDKVFPTTPTRKTFVADCKRAGIPNPDARGRTVDRHSLRKTFTTWLLANGVEARTVQKLARHSDIRLTTGTYTDESQLDDVAAVAKLPDLSRDDVPESIPLRATGTDNSQAESVVVDVVPKGREGSGKAVTGDKGQKRSPTVSGRACNDLRDNSQPVAIGARRFELPTSWSRTKRSNQAELRPVIRTDVRAGWTGLQGAAGMGTRPRLPWHRRYGGGF